MSQGYGQGYQGQQSEWREGESSADERRNRQRWQEQERGQGRQIDWRSHQRPEQPRPENEEWRRRENQDYRPRGDDRNRGYSNQWEASRDEHRGERPPSRYDADEYDRQFRERNDWEGQSGSQRRRR